MKSAILPKLYETVAKEAFFGIAVFDSTGECLFINSSAIQMLGTDAPKMGELSPHEDKPPLKKFGPELLKHEGLYQDILVGKKSGETFIAVIWVKTLKFDVHSAHLLMMQDVTLQKKLQREVVLKQNEIKATFEEVKNQNRQLKQLDTAKDRFIALTTHELRTPLSAMVASAEILKQKLYDTPEQMAEFIEIIYDQGLHLQELVNDILDFAKIQAGKMDFYIEEGDPAPVIENVVHGFAGMADSHQVKLNLIPPAMPLKCWFDEVRLRQVISNIVNNAIKYNRVDGTVHVTFTEDDDWVKIFVKDTGPGISSTQFEKVFNEFETIGQVALHHKGTGLGMPISRKLTEGMGGRLLLASKVGIGSTFWIEIPKNKILDESLYQSRPEKSGDFAA